ncbi:MAG: transcriptional repressor [Clostridium sp.]
MKTLKYSRQRESIKASLMSRKDHPTADAVYASIREEFPNISLGTVYRNLNLLVELGEAQKLAFGDGKDHFDADTSLHYHFVCRSCGAVYRPSHGTACRHRPESTELYRRPD